MHPKAEERLFLHYAALYRAEARADLYEIYGVSLAELISEKRFTELSDLLTQLPQASRFWAVMMEDESYCEMALDAHLSQEDDDEEVPKWAPAYRDYTANYQLLAQIYDAINVLNYTTAAVQGAKGVKKPKPLPSPKTGIDRAKERVAREQASSLYAALGREVPDFDVKIKVE